MKKSIKANSDIVQLVKKLRARAREEALRIFYADHGKVTMATAYERAAALMAIKLAHEIGVESSRALLRVAAHLNVR